MFAITSSTHCILACILYLTCSECVPLCLILNYSSLQVYMAAKRYDEAVPVLRHAVAAAAPGDMGAADALRAAEAAAQKARKAQGAAYAQALRQGQADVAGALSEKASVCDLGSTGAGGGGVSGAGVEAVAPAKLVPSSEQQLKELRRQARMFDKLFANMPCPALQLSSAPAVGNAPA
jgi:hypothetical protein